MCSLLSSFSNIIEYISLLKLRYRFKYEADLFNYASLGNGQWYLWVVNILDLNGNSYWCMYVRNNEGIWLLSCKTTLFLTQLYLVFYTYDLRYKPKFPLSTQLCFIANITLGLCWAKILYLTCNWIITKIH